MYNHAYVTPPAAAPARAYRPEEIYSEEFLQVLLEEKEYLEREARKIKSTEQSEECGGGVSWGDYEVQEPDAERLQDEDEDEDQEELVSI